MILTALRKRGLSARKFPTTTTLSLRPGDHSTTRLDFLNKLPDSVSCLLDIFYYKVSLIPWSKHLKISSMSHSRDAKNGAALVAPQKRAAVRRPPEQVSKRIKGSGLENQVKKPASRLKLSRPSNVKLQIFAAGTGSAGELGLGPNTVEVTRPVPNAGLSPESVGVVSVSVGAMHAAALTHDGKILTWGGNDDGALGRDTEWNVKMQYIDDPDEDLEEPELNPRESTPTTIPADRFPPGTNFVQVTAGDSATFALSEDGIVYGWGTFRVGISSILGVPCREHSRC